MDSQPDNLFDPNWFSDSYALAREKFVGLTSDFDRTSAVHPLQGREQEELAIDTACFGTHEPEITVLITTGLHGAEGYFGSAVLIGLAQWLRKFRLPNNVRVVLVHGLNPWGFSWNRRFDEQNIDNNRNFLLPDEDYSGSPEMYRRLESWLNPCDLRSGWVPFYLEAAWKVLLHGMGPLQQAIAGGQYEFPQGLFYGGSQPSWTHQEVKKLLPVWIANAGQVIHFDLHTGLGQYSRGACLLEAIPSPLQLQLLEKVVPADSIEQPVRPQSSTAAVNQTAYFTRGSLGRWTAQQSPGVDYLYGCLEFGTYAGFKMFEQLRWENTCFHQSTSASEKQRAGKLLREHFCPVDPAWRQKTTGTACDWIIRAISHNSLQTVQR